ncbi:BrnA antitoxin family protein [Marinomonas sp. C1424]|uniref:BrnA antitoxin family protein n=1 Tax=Marinomonas transparens TaxID=2795388 RepID=A0A934JNU0_9GAMM|nr:BrnA antitoxin family protein [Marinomonas transparens]
MLPAIVAAQTRGRPKSDNPKVSTTIRLSPDVLDYFKNEGKGWQSRIDKALKEYVDSHQ